MGVSVREKICGSGVWWVFVRHQGQRVSEKVGDRETALDAGKEIERDIRRGRFDMAAMQSRRAAEREESSAPTFAEYYSRFERVYLLTSTRRGTRQRYETSFKYVLPALGGLRIDEITRERVRDFVAQLVETRYQIRQKVTTYPDPAKKRNPVVEWTTVEKPLSKTSIRIILSQLCAVFSHAVEERVIAANPALKLGKFYKQAKTVHEQVEPLTAAEVETFLAAVQERPASREYYPVFLCAIHTGMRAGELMGLQWGDVDFSGKFILVRRQYTRGREEPTKTGKPRRVDMSDPLAAALLALRKRRRAGYLERGSNEIPKWVFCNREGNPLEYYNLKHRHFEKCLAAAGLRRIRFHDLRHTYATLLLMQKESPAYVRDQLGHSSIKVTVDIYTHWIPGSNRQAVNRLPVPGHTAPIAAASAE